MDYENIFNVLIRNNNFKQNAMLKLGDKYLDSKEVVLFAEREFPEDYNKAFAIVNDPNRETVVMYKDEYQYFNNKNDEACADNQCYFNLFNNFLERKELRPIFIEYLHELKKETAEENYSLYGDIDWHIIDFN